MANLERDRYSAQADDDPGEVDVADHHDVKMPEKLQFLQADGGLTICLGCLLRFKKNIFLKIGRRFEPPVSV